MREYCCWSRYQIDPRPLTLLRGGRDERARDGVGGTGSAPWTSRRPCNRGLDRPTLCGDWTVRDVVTHLISMNGAVYRVSASNRVDQLVQLHRGQTTSVPHAQKLLDAFQKMMGKRGLGRLIPPSAMLVKVLVHSQDIRRPWGETV
jgi:mycothiol maleylpyruvate isomerase-like protein